MQHDNPVDVPAKAAPSVPASRPDYNPLVDGKPRTMAETTKMMALIGRLEDERFLPHWWAEGVNRNDRRLMKKALRKILGKETYEYAVAMYSRMREARGTIQTIPSEPAGG